MPKMGRIADARGDSKQKWGNAAGKFGALPGKPNRIRSLSSLLARIH